MKSIIRIICWLIFFISSSEVFGEVKFNFHFDPIFDIPENSWMKQETQEAGELLGSVIKQNAQLNIKVKAVSYDDSSYAMAKNNVITFNAEQGLERAYASALLKIVTIGEYDANISINFNTINKNKNLYKTIIIHELTHVLGFSGSVKSLDREGSIIKYFQLYDELISDQNEVPFIIREDGVAKVNPKFDSEGYVYICGKNIRKRNGGLCIRLFNKKHYIDILGESFVHMDPKKYARNIMIPVTGSKIFSFWNKYEVGIMEDLGYKIDFEEFCNIYAKLHLQPTEYREMNYKAQGCPQDELVFQFIECEEYKLAPTECLNSNYDEKALFVLKRSKDQVPLITVQVGKDGSWEGYIKEDLYRLIFEVVKGVQGKLHYDLNCIKLENPISDSKCS